jgi:hypothetical protein
MMLITIVGYRGWHTFRIAWPLFYENRSRRHPSLNPIIGFVPNSLTDKILRIYSKSSALVE